MSKDPLKQIYWVYVLRTGKFQWEYYFLFSKLHVWLAWLFIKASREDADLSTCILAFSGVPLAVCATRAVNMMLQDESVLSDAGNFLS